MWKEESSRWSREFVKGRKGERERERGKSPIIFSISSHSQLSRTSHEEVSFPSSIIIFVSTGVNKVFEDTSVIIILTSNLFSLPVVMDMHSQNSDNNHGSQQSPPVSAATSSSPTPCTAVSRWYPEGPRMESASIPDEMDVFFHSMNEATGNSVNSYYSSSAAAVAARAAVHGYHRPSPHSKWLFFLPSLHLNHSIT